MPGKKKKKKKKKNNHKKPQQLPGNYIPEAFPGCHLIHDPKIPSWCLESESEPFNPLEFGLDDTNEHLMPEISIEPESNVVTLTNLSKTHQKSFFITFGHALLGRKNQKLSTGIWRNEDGNRYKCTTLVVVLQPRRLLEVCRVVPTRLNPNVSVWSATLLEKEDVDSVLDLYSTISEVKQDQNGATGATGATSATSILDASTKKRMPSLPFPLGGAGPYMCSQGQCGCFTHFYNQTKYAIDLSCPIGTKVLAVGNGTIINVKDNVTVGGIHSAHLFQWNSIMLKLDDQESNPKEDAVQKDDVNKKKAVQEKEAVKIETVKIEDVKQKDDVQKDDVQKEEKEKEDEKMKDEKKVIDNETGEASIYVEYVHIGCKSAVVKVGDRVRKGDVLCTSGDVGFCPTPHLHLQVHDTMVDNAPTIPFTLHGTLRSGDSMMKKVRYIPIAGMQYDPVQGPL